MASSLHRSELEKLQLHGDDGEKIFRRDRITRIQRVKQTIRSVLNFGFQKTLLLDSSPERRRADHERCSSNIFEQTELPVHQQFAAEDSVRAVQFRSGVQPRHELYSPQRHYLLPGVVGDRVERDLISTIGIREGYFHYFEGNSASLGRSIRE